MSVFLAKARRQISTCSPFKMADLTAGHHSALCLPKVLFSHRQTERFHSTFGNLLPSCIFTPINKTDLPGYFLLLFGEAKVILPKAFLKNMVDSFFFLRVPPFLLLYCAPECSSGQTKSMPRYSDIIVDVIPPHSVPCFHPREYVVSLAEASCTRRFGTTAPRRLWWTR